MRKWFDIGIIGLFVGWAFGRIGCLLNGDSLGILSKSKIAIWGHLPTQIFESLWSVMIAILCFWLLRKKADLKLPDGIIFWIGMGSYGLGRFIIDFFIDENKIFFFLKPGQIGSLVILIIAIIVIYFTMKAERKEV